TWNSNGGFSPLGDTSTPFTGTLDGLSHTINGLIINRPADNYVGVFGVVGGGMPGFVRNVGLIGGSVTGNEYVGGLVGYQAYGQISNSYTTGSVNGTHYVGGLVGYNDWAGYI